MPQPLLLGHVFQSLPQQCPFWRGPKPNTALEVQHHQCDLNSDQSMAGCSRAFPQFPEWLIPGLHGFSQVPVVTVDVFWKFLKDSSYLKKKKEAKCFLGLETNWSWAGCSQSWLHPRTHQNCIKQGLQGGACSSTDDFTAPRECHSDKHERDRTGTHPCDSIRCHWNKVTTPGLRNRPPATTPHCYVCIQHTSFSYNNIHCTSYFTSKTVQAVLALRNCSITITFVKKRLLSNE